MAYRDPDAWTLAMLACSGMPLHHEPPPVSAARILAVSAIDAEVIGQLARHRDAEVREQIARRLDCPRDVLALLAHDRRPGVRAAVASHRRAGAVLGDLARDRDASVLKALARNDMTPSRLLRALSVHRRADVRRAAQRMLDRRSASQVTATAMPSPASAPPGVA